MISVDPSWRVEIVPGDAPRHGARGGIGPRRALVVDATPSRSLIVAALSAVEGFEVEVRDSMAGIVPRSFEPRADVLVLEPHGCGADVMVAMRTWASAHDDDPPPVVWCTQSVPAAPELRQAVADGLRGVVLKPLRPATLTDMVVRMCRSNEREHRLRAGGVDAEELAALLSPETTRRWFDVEAELADAHVRPLSTVVVGALTPAVAGTVRRALRPADTLGQRDPRTLFVLLPDVDLAGAEVVAERLQRALLGFVPQPPAVPVSRRRGETPAAFLNRAAEAINSAIALSA